jgi:hypothetical protein
MLKIKISTPLTIFIVTTIISCSPVFADSNYTAVIQKISIRGNRLSADNISKVSSKTSILKLADTIGNTIDNQKKLPKLSFSLGLISLSTLNQSLKAQGIKVTYSKSICLSMRSQDEFPISLGNSRFSDDNHSSNFSLPFLVADRSFLTQGKPSSSDTGQPDKCVDSVVDSTRLKKGDTKMKLNLSKQGYMSREIGFKIVSIEKTQPVLKFDDADSTLEDERYSQSFYFLIDGGSQAVQGQIAEQIIKNHPNLYRFNTDRSVSEILSLANPRTKEQRSSIVSNGSNSSNSGSFDPTSFYPDYIVKLNVSP